MRGSISGWTPAGGWAWWAATAGGKTTLLRLLLGEYEYSGAISAPAELEYFPLRVAHPEADTRAVLEELAPGLEEWRLLRELAALEVDEGVLDRPFSTLSGGEQVKALLSVLFCGRAPSLCWTSPPTTWIWRAGSW